MNIASLLQGSIGAAVLDGVAKRLGIENKQVRLAIAVGLPLLITALRKNSEDPKAANGIMGAINEKHDGGILDNISGFFGNHKEEDQNDGLKILGHIFGNKQEQVTHAVSKESGLSAQKVVGILAMLAPVVMGLVGRNAKNQNGEASQTEGGLMGIIGNLMGGIDKTNPKEMGILDQILNRNTVTENQKPEEEEGFGAKLMNTLFPKS